MYVAEARNKWHATEREELTSIIINTNRLRQDLINLSVEQISFTNYVNALTIPVYSVSYEELFITSAGTFNPHVMRNLSEFIGITEDLCTVPTLKQTTPEPLNAIVANFDVVCGAIADWLDSVLLSSESVLGRYKSLDEC